MRLIFVTSIVVAGFVIGSFADASAQTSSGFVAPAWTHVEPGSTSTLEASVAVKSIEVRPAALPALYAGSVLLQALDVRLTLEGMSRGSVEANPMMRAVVKRPATFIAVKTAVAGLTIYAAERLWRKGKRKAAVALMVINTSMMAIVGARNASVVRGLK